MHTTPETMWIIHTHTHTEFKETRIFSAKDDAKRAMDATHDIMWYVLEPLNIGDTISVRPAVRIENGNIFCDGIAGNSFIVGQIVGWDLTSDGARAVWVNTEHGNQLYYPYQIGFPMYSYKRITV